jgi:secondary thiamine-phosphate synthase enzyme
MRLEQHRLRVATDGPGLYEITAEVATWVARQGISRGLLAAFLPHTSASLLIQENADPDVRADLERFFDRLVPEGARLYRHAAEGPDDMPAHIKAALTAVSLSVPVTAGRLALGTWQGIYLFEHRSRPHRREVVLHLITGE